MGLSEGHMAWLLGISRPAQAGQDAARFVTEALVDP